jgi:hypothetical protein
MWQGMSDHCELKRTLEGDRGQNLTSRWYHPELVVLMLLQK